MIKIKNEFQSAVIAFGDSGVPLQDRKYSELIDLGIIARRSGDETIVKVFEYLPSLNELKKMKMDLVINGEKNNDTVKTKSPSGGAGAPSEVRDKK